jgi:diguanylate cyclase
MSPTIAGRPASVLIVDDERDNRELLGVILTWEGFVCLTAASGKEALATVARKAPQLILLDVMMPGMNGYDVTATLKGDRSTKHIPIMLVTAMTDFNAKERGLDSGAEEFLPKPIDRDVLVLQLHLLLRKTYAGGYDAG